MLINTEKALSVIIGIFVSVAIAFTFGVLVQYAARLFFTFGYRAREKYFIALFGGVGLSSVIYFILFKGLKGSVLMTPAIERFVSSHSISVLVACFVCSAVLSEILYLLRFNVLKLIVACGTFSLALAFAGNDLVNFIGVPLETAKGHKITDYRKSAIAPEVIWSGIPVEGMVRREGTQEYFASVYPIWEEHQIRGSISIVTSLVQFEKRESEAHMTLEERVRRFERQEIQNTLLLYGRDMEGKQKAAKELGISLATLYNKIKE